MKSLNFEMFRENRPILAELGALAESYAHTDPPSALVKLRTFAEQTTIAIYESLALPKALENNLNDLLNQEPFQEVVPSVVRAKIHALRIEGNKAAHANAGSTQTALRMLHEAYDIGRWFMLTFSGGPISQSSTYVEPSPGGLAGETKERLKREKKAVLEQLSAQEARLQQLLSELEAARNQPIEIRSSQEDLRRAAGAATNAASALHFDEDSTRRRLVDSMLGVAGWNVGSNSSTNDQVAQEYPVKFQPTDSGLGYADYVLWGEDGKPLGVVEAKKTAIDAEAGRTQASFYADGLEQTFGQRPIIFYTNGFELWIWNDAAHEPPRRIYGFYSPESLQYLHFKASERRPLKSIAPKPEIAGRLYQLEAIRRVCERFSAGHRKALVVLATGTGKTRVAASLSELLIRARWAKRILFLCDRLELRKQAGNVFKEWLPGEPRTYVSASTSHDLDKRIYLATYPAMMKCYESFDVGFFDLIIPDESHRSIYNRYREIFQYFDALQVGLTATPADLIVRNTYQMFDCENQDPTAHYSFDEAIRDTPPSLVPFRVQVHTTQFLREGMKYREMSAEQRRQLDESEDDPTSIDYDREQVDRQIFNKDTNRAILRNLMEHGIRDATGTNPGKTIIFARNHNHALVLQELFDQMYPQYGGNFCRIIDNYDPRAEELIDDFKGIGNNPELTIAISVDMLDTGVDVPEIVNLVLAKPVYSKIKFWQMIGRGTRLCPDLFGLGKDKSEFLIFDHWENFDYFGENYSEVEPTLSKSLAQSLFELRLELAEEGQSRNNQAIVELAVRLIGQDIAALPSATVSVKEKGRELRSVADPQTLRRFEPATAAVLRQEIAPLMRWRSIFKEIESYRFDRLVGRLQLALLRGSARFQDYKGELISLLAQLPTTLNQVQAHAATIAKLREPQFWQAVTVAELEEIRLELRGVMQNRVALALPNAEPRLIDVAEDLTQIQRRQPRKKIEGLELAAYRNRVQSVLKKLFEQNSALKKIKAGEAVSEEDLRGLTALVLDQDPELDLNDLLEFYPESGGHLEVAIRKIIGMDAPSVDRHFTDFVRNHPELVSRQIQFLSMLKNHIARYGSIELERLYEAPFTSIHSDGIDGVFTDNAQVNELLDIVSSFKPQADRVVRVEQ